MTLLLVGLTSGAFVACKGERGEKKPEKPATTRSQVKTLENGNVAVPLDREAQAASGIVTQELPRISRRQEWRAFGAVVDVGDLAEVRRRAADARAQAEKARASLRASRKEHERLSALYADDRNASAKAVEAAQAAASTDQASAEAAETTVAALEATARERWGPVIGGWATGGSPALERLLRRQDVLVSATLSPDTSLPQPPDTAFLERDRASRVVARFVSEAARTDPRIQGTSLFYVASAGSGLLPGMSVTVSIPAGAAVSGSRVPRSAVVWTEARAWIYTVSDPTTFVRRPIATDSPEGESYFVVDLPPQARVVIGGAQILLSEESRSQLRAGEEVERD
ncbi:MAG: efflux RND transporter periplasmic adaptor subunit [Acidobacteriota bacterium]|nr:efflux RND transporter periplasmic adaptor subunit [Acidobacteriota bacterium]